ncbi:MAG: DNA primase [Cellulomonadaceae bacterium]|nr:DNA primase [Cellulomonadaceae bacterium]
MAGLILREDVDLVRERAQIEQVIGAQVALSNAGIGSLKGLCPFHEEKSASFYVRPGIGRYHCFGCGEGGDVINYLQKTAGLSFTDAIEHLAALTGVQLRYEQGGANRESERSNQSMRQRALAANQAAQHYFESQLVTAQAGPGRRFLSERAFDREAAKLFGIGFAPPGWDNLTRHLMGKGYTAAELTAAGLVTQGSRGVYDRFRGRLTWPIRDTTSQVIGFGARELPEFVEGDKKQGKYLNTPETVLYKKSQVLFGLDLAKDAIRTQKQVVVVEGYTDVMAMWLAGIQTAVATCGTAFSAEHAKVIRRLMGDHVPGSGLQLSDGASLGGEIIFTFDGDAAGQKAAVKAFGQDHQFYAQTFVANEQSGMDPCELRLAKGSAAVKALVANREPLFAFVIRAKLAQFDLGSVEGRIGALRAAAPIVAQIRDTAFQGGYVRELAGWIGLDVEQVRHEVSRAARAGTRSNSMVSARADTRSNPTVAARAPNGNSNPILRLEKTLLAAVLQYPELIPVQFDQLSADIFSAPAFGAVFHAIKAAGGVQAGAIQGARGWVATVAELGGTDLADLIGSLAVTNLPEDRPEQLAQYCVELVAELQAQVIAQHLLNAKSRLQRTDPSHPSHSAALAAVVELEAARRTITGR